MLWRLLKTGIFTILVPGAVAVLIPLELRRPLGWCLSFSSWREISGVALFTGGVGIYLWCAWDFAVKGLGTPAPIDAPRRLVVKGLYRFTRNPMYIGVGAMILGQAVYFGSRSIAIYLCIVILFFNLFVRLYEEPTLRRLFGAQYQDYCRRVPRWLM